MSNVNIFQLVSWDLKFTYLLGQRHPLKIMACCWHGKKMNGMSISLTCYCFMEGLHSNKNKKPTLWRLYSNGLPDVLLMSTNGRSEGWP